MNAQPRLTDYGPPGPPSPFRILDGFVSHPYIKDRTVEARDFQLRIAEQCLRQNTLVVVPTGLGKTLVAVLVAAESLRTRKGTVLFLAPTRPLALQHYQTLQNILKDEGLIQFFSGGVSPKRRQETWGRGILVVATPQTIRNDLDMGRYTLEGINLVIFDEAHRAVGDYAYVALGRRLAQENPGARLLGLTASPGAQRDRVAEVMRNLGVEVAEMRDPASVDVQPFVQRVHVETAWVALSTTVRRVAKPFHELVAEKEKALRDLGVLRTPPGKPVNKRELVALQQSLGRSGFFAGLHAAQVAYYALLCVEYAETQGLDPLRRYLQRLRSRPDLKRNEKSFLKNERTQEALELLDKPFESSHPKADRLAHVLAELLRSRPGAAAIVFAQYRDTVESLVELLRARGIACKRFVGQQARGDQEGMDQEAQRAALEAFGRREFNVLVSTQIGEEGIDVPQVDLVVFYEAIPSEIRSIQRRGRTGRTVAGRVLILVTEGTVEQAYYFAAQKREKKMRSLVSAHAPR